MNIIKKEISRKTFLSAKKTLTIPEIPIFATETTEKLFEEIEKLNLKVTGPYEFIYFGCTGDLEESFELLIGIPIEQKKNESENFLYFDSAAYTCISTDYMGNIEGIGSAWCSFFEEVKKTNFIFSPDNHAREIYKRWEGLESPDNIAELQIKITA